MDITHLKAEQESGIFGNSTKNQPFFFQHRNELYIQVPHDIRNELMVVMLNYADTYFKKKLTKEYFTSTKMIIPIYLKKQTTR